MRVLLQGNEIACTAWMLPHRMQNFLVQDLTQPSMQVCEECVHLLLRESAGERRHIALASEDSADDLRIRRRSATGKRGATEDIAETGRWRLEGEVVFFMAVRTTSLIQMLTCGLLRIESGLRAASGEGENESEAEEGL
jgi:hypothetical protein